MPVILRDEDTHIAVTHLDNTGVIDHIPAHIYRLRLNAMTKELLLVKDRKRFDVPEVKFGKHNKWKNAITSRYDRLGSNLGALLYGQKGTGKSMLSEDLCNWMLTQDLPVLLVDVQIPASILTAAVRVIGPCLIYFDEFGKVYTDEDDRNSLLTLFSDSSFKGVVFIVTGNDSTEFTDFMFNRPGRFELAMYFRKLDLETAHEIGTHFHLNPDMMDILLCHTARRDSSVDIALKLCRTLRQCKTVEEAEEEMSIMNIPDPAWYQISITEAFLQGHPMSSTRLVVRSVKNEVAEIAILNEFKETIRTVTIDFKGPLAQFVSKQNSQACVSVDGTPDGNALSRSGEYTYKVDDEFRITFYRYIGDIGRDRVWLHAQTPEEKEELRRKQEEYQKGRNESGGRSSLFSHPFGVAIDDSGADNRSSRGEIRPDTLSIS